MIDFFKISLTSCETRLFLFRLAFVELLMDESAVRVAEPTPLTVLLLTFVPPPPTSLCSVPGLWNKEKTALVYRYCAKSSFVKFSTRLLKMRKRTGEKKNNKRKRGTTLAQPLPNLFLSITKYRFAFCNTRLARVTISHAACDSQLEH